MQAVQAFLTTVQDHDLPAMNQVWGTAKGPVAATMERAELEKRGLIVQCHLQHDRVRLLGDYEGEAGRRIWRVELTKGTLVRLTTITTIRGPAGRWYVEAADIEKTVDLCRMGGIGR